MPSLLLEATPVPLPLERRRRKEEKKEKGRKVYGAVEDGGSAVGMKPVPVPQLPACANSLACHLPAWHVWHCRREAPATGHCGSALSVCL